jgi:hypothetical protein
MDWTGWIAQWVTEAPVLAGSAAVVLLMIAVAWALGFRAQARLSEEALMRLAEAEGAALQHALITPDGRAALARLSNGKVMLARVMGHDFSARAAPAGAVRVRFAQGRLSAAFADTGFPPLNMQVESPPAWLAELAQGSP